MIDDAKQDNLARFVEYRVEKQIEDAMLDYKTEIRRELAEHREDNHMQIEHHFREFHHHKWVNSRQSYYPWHGFSGDKEYYDPH